MPNSTGAGATAPGIDLKKYHEDVRRLVRSKCRFPTLDPDDLLQEVYLAILKKNISKPWDPTRAAMSKFIVLVAGSTALHMLQARRFRPEAQAEEAPEVADERDPIGAFEVARELGLDPDEFGEWLKEQDELTDQERAAARRPVAPSPRRPRKRVSRKAA